MLEEIIGRAVGLVKGAKAVYLIGMDGVPVAGVGDLDGFPMDVVAASFPGIIRNIQRLNEEADLDDPTEITMSCPTAGLVLRRVTDEYVLLGLMEPGGHVGHIRYELLKASMEVKGELELA